MVQIHDLRFEPYLGSRKIAARVQALGRQIRQNYEGKRPLFVSVLNGAFVFAADLMRACEGLEAEIAFVRLASYEGTQSSGKVNTLLGLEPETVAGRHLLLVEDIVDSGRTLHFFLEDLRKMNPASIELAVLLRKPEAVEFELPVRYLGFDIPNKFVVGYGLDYNGLGRNLKGIYQLRG